MQKSRAMARVAATKDIVGQSASTIFKESRGAGQQKLIPKVIRTCLAKVITIATTIGNAVDHVTRRIFQFEVFY